jgi:hypothetical protein
LAASDIPSFLWFFLETCQQMYSEAVSEPNHIHKSVAGFSCLKVHKRENFLGFDFEICTFS